MSHNFRYMIVLADKASVPFCYYNNPFYGGGQTLIPADTLKKGMDFALENNMALNLVLGKKPLPEDYGEVLGGMAHSVMALAGIIGEYPEGVGIADINETGELSGDYENLVLKVCREDISKIPAWFEHNASGIKRLNIHISNIEDFKEGDYDVYESVVKQLSEKASVIYKNKNFIEVNILSDRVVIEKMNNCGAGLLHITLAPNGRFYICPGFYYDDPENSIGDLEGGIDIKNPELLGLDHAPVCSACDAWHCKRCVYLNKKLTLEINTPSRQQCVIAHVEREASRLLLDKCKDIHPFNGMKPIRRLNYYDPLDVITKRVEASPELTKTAGGAAQSDFENDVKYKLTKILDTQQEILNELRNKKGGR